jgi:RNA polymerase sigma-70 factor (ECF subfamily)
MREKEEMPDSDTAVTALFARMRAGDTVAGEQLLSALYTELHRLAVHYMRSEGPQHTLQPTALIHEAYLRLMSGPEHINDRHHFFALAAQAMRRVLVDHARKKRTSKRGGGVAHVADMSQVDLVEAQGANAPGVDVLALDDALIELSRLDPRAAQVVELRFFGGHTDNEVCEILGKNLATVRRDWEFARSWLKHRLHSDA